MPEAPGAKKIGTGMFVTAWVVFLVLLSWYFGWREEQRYNPNQNIISLDDTPSLVLKKNIYGQYVFTGAINGTLVDFLVDTGANSVVVSHDIAQHLGLIPGKAITVTTASGYSKAWKTRIDKLDIGSIRLTEVDAIINPSMPNNQALLGMTALQHINFKQENNTLVLYYSP